MLRILLLSPAGAGTHYFGPGMSAWRLYNMMGDNSTARVSLLHGNRDQERLSVFEDQYFIPEYRKNSFCSGLRFLLNCRKWIKKNAHRFDVVHCLGLFYFSFIPAVWLEKESVPVFLKVTVGMERGFSESSAAAKLLGLESYRKRHANRISGYISISSAIQNMLIHEGISPEKIYQIPNGVDSDRFRPATTEQKLLLRREVNIPDKFTVVFTGNFSRRKNPLHAVLAFRHLLDLQDRIQLVLIGPNREGDSQRDEIQKIISESGMSNIILREFELDIERYYRASDLFILPSGNEGLSNSMIEAQSCGLPALVTPVSGAEDLIEESSNGYFIGEKPEVTAEIIKRYFNNKDMLQRHSEVSREKIERYYSSVIILQKHLDLFRNVGLAKGNP